MNWKGMLAAVSGEGEASSCEQNGDAILLTGTPPIRVYRQNCRPNSYATPHGSGTYDPSGGLLLAQTDRYPDAIYADSTFLTCVSCGIDLPEPHTLSVKPAQMAGLKNFFKKAANYQVQWSVKTDLSERIQAQLLDFLNAQNQECLKHITVQLVPVPMPTGEERNHHLTVATKLLPDDLNNFCLVEDFYPLRQDGTRMSDLEAACFMVESMICCCRSLYSVLAGNEEL